MDKLKQFFNNPSRQIYSHRKLVNKGMSFAWSIARIIILLAIGYIIIYPLFYMIVTSLRSRQSYYDTARVWLPSSLDPEFSYGMAMDALDYWKSLGSTVSLEIVAAIIEIITCSIVAYGFARFKFKLKPILMAGLFLTILIPETMIILPRMVNYSQMDFLGILGLIGKLIGQDIRPNHIGSPLAFYLPS